MAVVQLANCIIFARQERDATALTGGRLYVYVDDVDAHCSHVLESDVTASSPRDEPWGDSVYSTRDLQGHPWTFATPSGQT